MPRPFRNPLQASLPMLLALIATVGLASDVDAHRASRPAHHKKHKKQPRKHTHASPHHGPRKHPPRPGAVRNPAGTSLPAASATPASGATPASPVTSAAPAGPGTPQAAPALPVIGPLDVATPFPSGMRLFAPASFWNRPLPAGEPLDARSGQLTTALLDEVRAEMPTRKGPWINMNAWSVPVYTVGADVPKVHVTLDVGVVALQRDYGAVPIPAGAHASAGTDRHLVVYQPSADTMWEFYRAQLLADGWHARWGGKMSNVSSNPGYFPNPLGASATSLPLLGGLTTIAELKAGAIDHALAMAVPNTDAARVTWPAQRGDGRVTGATAIPEGTQFRIDPSVDLSTLRLTPVGLAFARAAQRYGMVIRDSADCVTFYAEDPTVAAAPNPYPQILGGLYPDQALKNFPWDKLRVVAPRRP